ncbi:molybdopterin-dependent oxidoreductase [Promethearchaeum syntrophicum]|uniref:Molybdopterin-dependent oxidoreductase n=1 Tax=Promethearchaeum syntrophicum TaxID=2594042 RepID=A0A5B9D7M6_9ARCH|nr:molybdopterin-dependent oxidoreductase [Candidatus Prometheoarchaeum syntrophicum]QEE15023.1 Formate dehydrogenase subunit alpha [Candidatus Prometheoarchaeum syntrophicum]
MDLNKNHTLIPRFGTCTKDCYGSCVFTGYWDDSAPIQKLVKANPNKKHPFTQGIFCPKFTDRQTILYHEERIKHPLYRLGKKGLNQFQNISFSKAWETLLYKINEVLNEHGPRSIMFASYCGNTGLISGYYPLRFFYNLGSFVSKGGICNEGGLAGLAQMFGTYSMTNPFQINNSETHLIVVWASDLSENNNHLYNLVRKAQKKGTKLVVVDSKITKISQQADLHIRPAQNSDVVLSSLILQKLVKSEKINYSFLKKHVKDYEHIIDESLQTDEEEKHKIVRVNINNLTYLIELLIEHKNHTIFTVGYGIQKDFFGGKIVQSIALLQIFLGNFGRAGTGLLYSQSDYNKSLITKIIQEISQDRLFSSKNEYEIISLSEALEDKKIKLLIISNFNPANSLPNQTRLRKSLMRKDLFTVVLEVFQTETTSFADLVFPMKFDVETNEIVASYYIPGLSINQSGKCPYPDCLSNFEFFTKLGYDLGKQRNWKLTNLNQFKGNDSDLLDKCLDIAGNKIKTEVLENGYSLFFKEDSVFFKNLIFPTPSTKIELTRSSLNLPNPPLLFKFPEDDDSEEFTLLTPHHPRFLHSQLGVLNRKFYPDFEKVFVADHDLKKIKCKIGDQVLVFNQLGTSEFIIDTLNSLQSGVALIYSGGPIRSNDAKNPNYFTPDIPEELGHSGSYNSARIRIKKIK